MTRRNTTKTAAAVEYREEAVKPAIYAMLAAVLVVAVPLAWFNKKVDEKGFRSSDTTRYRNLVAGVDLDVKAVRGMLDHELVDGKALRGIKAAPVVTLITPVIAPTNMQEAVAQDPAKFKVELSGIYWNAHDPIATINGENYRNGETVEGHRIVEIRKTEVVFEGPTGDKIVKYFYDYLDTTTKKKRR